MKPFRFSLEAVRQLREHQERAAAAAYAQALQAADEASRRLQVIADDLAAAQATSQRSVQGKTTVAELKRSRDYLDILERRHLEAERELAILRSRAEEAFVANVSARKALAVLDKYGERQKRRHHRHQRRAEQKALDDLWRSRGPLALALQIGLCFRCD